MSEYIVEMDDGQRGKEEIVRCRDCKRIEYCRFYAKDKDKPNGFCSWGERKGA